MPVEIVMPKLGLTMAAGTIGRWLKNAGDTVREGDPLLEIATDKISYEVNAPATGTIANTIGKEGDEFECGAVIGTITVGDESDIAVPAAAAARVEQPVEAPRVSAAASPAPAAAAHSNGTRVIASPAARRLAREHGVTLAHVRGTGPRGRITLEDVVIPTQASQRQPAQTDAFPPRLPPQRRTIYRKMTAVGVLPIPQVETPVRVDAVKALLEARGDFGWTAYAVYAVARLLREHVELRTDASTGAPFERIGIGIACDTPHGLIVPVVRDADLLTLAATQKEIARLSAAARAETLAPSEIGGACFSISNVGPQGVERVAPLPDPPQTAILGIGAVTQRPAVIAGVLQPAWMMTAVVSFDHRFVDGAPAARFLAALAQAFGDPGRLL